MIKYIILAVVLYALIIGFTFFTIVMLDITEVNLSDETVIARIMFWPLTILIYTIVGIYKVFAISVPAIITWLKTVPELFKIEKKQL